MTKHTLINKLKPLHNKNILWENNDLRMRKCLYGTMVYPGQDMYIGRSLDVYGEYMQSEVNLFKELLKAGDVAIDIGANIGAHTIPLAQIVGKKGTVIGFEPQRYCYNILTTNVVLNGLHNVHLFHAAIGDKKGTVQVPYVLAKKNINLGGSGIAFWEKSKSGESVKSMVLDSVKVNKCDFIKIDVEGMELQVLQGGQKFIHQHRPILFIEDDNAELREPLRKFLHEQNYNLYFMTSLLYPANNFFCVKEDIFKGQNATLEDKSSGCFSLVCLPKDKDGGQLPSHLIGKHFDRDFPFGGFSISKIEET